MLIIEEPYVGWPTSYTHDYFFVCDRIKSTTTCPEDESYGAALCKCDKQAAHCFSRGNI